MRAAAAWHLIRPGNGAMTAVGVLVGAVVVAGPVALTETQVALAAVAAFLAASFGNVLNDLTDVEVDRVAHPRRPLPSGAVSLRAAALFATTLGAGAVLLAAAVDSNISGPRAPNLAMAGFVLAALGLMTAYELALKARGLPGNVVVALLTGAPFVFGALALGVVPTAVLLLAALAALANLGREVIKDVEDMHADVDRVTLPQRIGRRRARWVAAGVLVLGVALSPLPYTVGDLGWAYLPLVVVADAGFLAAAAAPQPRDGQRLAKAGMVVALGAFLAGRVTGGSVP